MIGVCCGRLDHGSVKAPTVEIQYGMGTDLGKEALLEGSMEPVWDPCCTWQALSEDTLIPYVEKAWNHLGWNEAPTTWKG